MRAAKRFWVIFLLLIMGCGGRGGITLPNAGENPQPDRPGSAARTIWGMWHVSIDSNTLDASIDPIRGAQFTANVTRFMQPPISPINLLSITVDPESDPPNGYFVLYISAHHPFPGIARLSGFDVRGILFSDGSIQGIHDPGVLRAGPGDTRLVNADGYTRWWNWPEFMTYGKIFGATQGASAPVCQPTSTVNGYKYFADGLDSDQPVASLDPLSRGFFRTVPGVNTRRYEVRFKQVGGQTVFAFNYAIDASWSLPDPAYEPDYPVEAFDLSANCREAFNVSVDDTGSTAWYVDETHSGGELALRIEVFDWQGGASGNVPGEVSGIFLEGGVLPGEYDVLANAAILPGTTANSSIYEVEIADLSLTSSGLFELFGTVESSNPNTYKPQVPNGDAFEYPAAPLAAYFTCRVSVLDAAPLEISITGIEPDEGVPDCTPEHVVITGDGFIDGATTFRLERAAEPDIAAENVQCISVSTIEGDLLLAGALPGPWDAVVENPGGATDALDDGFTVLPAIYVDGDNAGDPLMDGTPDHPFDTIQKGVDAAYGSSDEPVIVDQCLSNYAPFTLHDNSHVIGCNWNDGSGWPTVTQEDQFTYGPNVNNVTIEGLFFDLYLHTGTYDPNWHYYYSYGVYFDQGTGITITRCKFSGYGTVQFTYFVHFLRSSDVEISYCEFTNLFRRGPTNEARMFSVLDCESVTGLLCHHCEFHHIGYDQADSGEYGSQTEVIRTYGWDPHTSNEDFHNLLIYDLFDKTNAVGQTQNYLSAFGIYQPSGDYFKLHNVTVDDIRHADPPSDTIVESGHVNAAYMAQVWAEVRTWKNNIVSNIQPTDESMESGVSSYYGWWVDNYCDPPPSPQPMDYSLCSSLGKPLPNGANTWQWDSGFINQCSAGVGCYQNSQDIDPMYDMTPGSGFYHPTNPLIASGADDGSEMGAFGGPEGDWIPPSQLE